MTHMMNTLNQDISGWKANTHRVDDFPGGFEGAVSYLVRHVEEKDAD
jgi:hypothetical protein